MLACCALVCASVPFLFPKAWDMVVNADSLVLIDFARDILSGKSIAAWNLPRAPYLFPDTVIALLVMFFGWSNDWTFLIISIINYSLLTLLAHWIFKQAGGISMLTPLWGSAVVVAISLLILCAVFPFSAGTLFWQIFASGAHFLTAIVVVWILELLRPSSGSSRRTSSRVVWLAALLTLAEAVSDSMSALLVFIWWGTVTLDNAHRGFRGALRYLLLPCMVVLGTALSFLIPRQSLTESFFSVDRFVVGIRLFFQWVQGAPSHFVFIGVLILATVAFPLLLQGRLPRGRDGWRASLFSNNVLPSLGLICATPFFYQDVGSLRYLAFPGLIAILSLSLLLQRALSFFLRRKRPHLIILLVAFGLAAALYLRIAQNTRALAAQAHTLELAAVIDGPRPASNAMQGLGCIEQAARNYPLEDGVATYWNARPIYFRSNFERFLAQVSPWHPRSGYLYWGNNGLDAVLREGDDKKPRRYNYILATNDELALAMWGSLPARTTAQERCALHTVLFFKEGLLENYLFPFGPPFGVSPSGTPTRLHHEDREWHPDPYWGADLFTLAGEREGRFLRATGRAGALAYGPYVPLPAGSYRLVVRGQLSGPTQTLGLVDVIAGQGKVALASKEIKERGEGPGIILQLDFALARAVKDAEFRVLINAGVHGTLEGYELTKMRGR